MGAVFLLVFAADQRVWLLVTECYLLQPQTGIQPNADGSTYIYFAPTPPGGKESNWMETVQGKGWFVVLRMYGATVPWFDESCRLSEITLLDDS